MWQVRLWQMGKLLPGRLAAHLEAAGCLPVLYLPQWLLTAFASSYPLVFAARLVDVILADSFAEPMMKVLRTLLTRSSPCRAELGHKLSMLQKPALPSMRRRA